MLVEPFWKVYQKIGKFFLPLLFLLFFICSFLVIFTSVRTKSIHYYEGQVVEESIRANKTIKILPNNNINMSIVCLNW